MSGRCSAVLRIRRTELVAATIAGLCVTQCYATATVRYEGSVSRGPVARHSFDTEYYFGPNLVSGATVVAIVDHDDGPKLGCSELGPRLGPVSTSTDCGEGSRYDGCTTDESGKYAVSLRFPVFIVGKVRRHIYVCVRTEDGEWEDGYYHYFTGFEDMPEGKLNIQLGPD